MVSAVLDLGEGVVVASVGSEGMVGVPLVLGGRTPGTGVRVHIAGNAVRLEADALRSALVGVPRLRYLLQRYALALLRQVAQTAACNLSHTLEERCAKWLLLTHDRVGRPGFALPQEVLAQMLGVHRPAVSLAAGMLQRAGAITYIRGHITMVDRAALEALSCACYSVITAEYRRLLGRPP
jgi:CRP-like cAMP-binding protein